MARLTSAIKHRRIELPALQGVIDRVQRLALTTESNRVLLSCAKLLVVAERMNQADEHKAEPDELIVREEGGRLSSDDQRAAIQAAIRAEIQKRANRIVEGKVQK